MINNTRPYNFTINQVLHALLSSRRKKATNHAFKAKFSGKKQQDKVKNKNGINANHICERTKASKQ